MGRKRKLNKEQSVKEFVKHLRAFDKKIKVDLRLPSINEDPPRVEGYAFKYNLLLPVLSAAGKRVFTDEHLSELLCLLWQRFGGCLAMAASFHPPLYGFYQPEGRQPEKDYHTQIVVLANPIDASDVFFIGLKAILRTAPLIRQEEIVVERSDVKLL